jgi:hypothetical protein
MHQNHGRSIAVAPGRVVINTDLPPAAGESGHEKCRNKLDVFGVEFVFGAVPELLYPDPGQERPSPQL